VDTPEITNKEYEFYKTKAFFLARLIAPGYPIDDMVGWAMVSLVKSIRAYDESKNMTRHNYILQNMRWDLRDALRDMRLGTRKDSSKGVFFSEQSLDLKSLEMPQEPDVDIGKIDLYNAIAKLPPKRRKYIETYLECDDPEQASSKLGISTQCGHQLHWQAIQKLRELMVGEPATVT
jgi:RNA polymerase sigma factor (sigma-70 family)